MRSSIHLLVLLTVAIVSNGLPVQKRILGDDGFQSQTLVGRDIYLNLPKKGEAETKGSLQTEKLGLQPQTEAVNYPTYLQYPSGMTAPVMLVSPITTPSTAATGQIVSDPQAVWKAPMIPSGQFQPMPNLHKQVLSTVKVASDSKQEEGLLGAQKATAIPSKLQDDEDKHEEPKKEDEPKFDQSVVEPSKPADAPKPVDDPAKPADASKPADPPKPENNSTPPPPPKVRRGILSNGMNLVKRQDSSSTNSTCPSSTDQFVVPVTYSELQGINEGTMKLQRLPDQKKSEEIALSDDCLNAETVVAPISDEQMQQLQAGKLKLVPTDQTGQVSLESVDTNNNGTSTATSSTDQAGAGAGVQEDAPMFDVVPIEQNQQTISTTLDTAVQQFGQAKSAYQSEAQDVKNIAQGIKSSGDLDGDDIHIFLEKRSPTIETIPLNTMSKLEKRISDPKGDDTKLFGNGQGKRKYNHAIHYNSAFASPSFVPQRIPLLLLCSTAFVWLHSLL